MTTLERKEKDLDIIEKRREEKRKRVFVFGVAWSKTLKDSKLAKERRERGREMVGSGGADRSKEAVGMMALHEALRSVCLNTDWTYSVFWTIRPRPYVPLSLALSLSRFPY